MGVCGFCRKGGWSLPIKLLKAQATRIVVVDLMDGVLKHLPCLICKTWGFLPELSVQA